MKLFEYLEMPRLATAARRLYCPVSKFALVLEVGSGDSPYPRSDVLLDISLNDYERGRKLVIDRPLIIGMVECMPFKDGAFDFSIASHVLEHSADPMRFLLDLQRVSRAGYIETPSEILEILEPVPCHRLFVRQKENHLIITKKASWNPMPVAAEDWRTVKIKSSAANKFIANHEMDLMVRYFWKGIISFEITNQTIDCSWRVPHPDHLKDRGDKRKIGRNLARDLIYRWAKFRRREIPWTNLLRCVDCFGIHIIMDRGRLWCKDCGRHYQVHSGIPIMLPKGMKWD